MSNLKKHHLTIEKVDKQSAQKLEAELMDMTGVIHASVDSETGDVAIEYDFEKCGEEDLERCITECGLTLDSGFLQRFKRGWIHFTEENERENLQTPTRSCCELKETVIKGHGEKEKEDSGREKG